MRRNKFKTRRKFERLEDRRMMTGNVEYDEANQEIIVTNADDFVTVRFFTDEEDGVDVGKVKVEIGEGLFSPDETELISDVKKITFNGGEDNDTLTVSIEQLPDGVTVSGVALVFNGGDGDDELIQNDGGIQTTANGGVGNDKLEGSRYNDVLNGGADNDTYVYRGRSVGSDEIQEAANVGTDTLDFSQFDTFVSVDLERVYSPSNPTNFLATGFMTNLQLKQSNPTGLENVKGSALTDTIRGNSRPNYFLGGDEDDKLEGRGGNDILDGQAGSDRYEFGGTNLGTDEIEEAADSDDDLVSFRGMSSGVTVDISKAGSEFAVDSANLKLILANDTAIERVFGSNYGDTITGNRRNNTLKGFDGRDKIHGGIGVDYLYGGADNDRIYSDLFDEVYGEAGTDTFDGVTENSYSWLNPRPFSYLDWGVF